MPITGVDVNSDNTKVVASSKDGHAYVFDIKSRQLLDKVSFKYKPDMKNMIMRACLFREDDSLYTLCTQPREPSFLIRWRPLGNKKYEQQTTSQVHRMASTGMRFNGEQT